MHLAPGLLGTTLDPRRKRVSREVGRMLPPGSRSAPWHSSKTPSWAKETAHKKLECRCRERRVGSPRRRGVAGEQQAWLRWRQRTRLALA